MKTISVLGKRALLMQKTTLRRMQCVQSILSLSNVGGARLMRGCCNLDQWSNVNNLSVIVSQGQGCIHPTFLPLLAGASSSQALGFQILRELTPHSDQKRDTASFLLEVIEYVQLLQEKVQKYEGSYQGWSTEPTKLMPWRHNHWQVQSFLGHPQATKNGPLPVATFAGKFDEKGVSINPSMMTNAQSAVDADSTHDGFGALDQQSELGEKAASLAIPIQMQMPTVVQSDKDGSHFPQGPASDALPLPAPCATSNDVQQGNHMIEGGTISISSVYSHGLLMTLTQALQNSGVDLSQANISIRIDLGKRATQSLISGISGAKEQENSIAHDLKIGHVRDGSSGEELEQPQKKLKS